LKDSGNYPYKALAHCLVATIGELNGPKAITETGDHLNNPKDFFTEINDRENENRARHGVPKLTIDSELNTRAQRWADKLAKDCQGMHHMADIMGKDTPDLQYQGKKVGENIFEGGESKLSDSEEGIDAANEWYSEIQFYPWPVHDGKNGVKDPKTGKNGVIGRSL